MDVEIAGRVSYVMLARRVRVLWAQRWLYRLVRTEGAATEEIVCGCGPQTRAAIGWYLQDVRELGGPDAQAADAAIRAGWVTQVCP